MPPHSDSGYLGPGRADHWFVTCYLLVLSSDSLTFWNNVFPHHILDYFCLFWLGFGVHLVILAFMAEFLNSSQFTKVLKDKEILFIFSEASEVFFFSPFFFGRRVRESGEFLGNCFCNTEDLVRDTSHGFPDQLLAC